METTSCHSFETTIPLRQVVVLSLHPAIARYDDLGSDLDSSPRNSRPDAQVSPSSGLLMCYCQDFSMIPVAAWDLQPPPLHITIPLRQVVVLSLHLMLKSTIRSGGMNPAASDLQHRGAMVGHYRFATTTIGRPDLDHHNQTTPIWIWARTWRMPATQQQIRSGCPTICMYQSKSLNCKAEKLHVVHLQDREKSNGIPANEIGDYTHT